ncbi:hypothetical protein [Undibacterium fentianense]|uniref:Uncharacterized protein n=1 Tax=Undibacterium fentianense TaxID=2828728 RepID=A0A941E2A8_9BURK|nr:hypothetical protein [Undibacterium fentianense]MBR7800106.1 hypothetical protein [Undibacterium fentianense]
MKTHPIQNSDGTLRGFEISSTWVLFWPLLKVLKSVEGVSEVKRQWFNEDRVIFKYFNVPAVINEPWGDNSRYWVGLQEPDVHPSIDISPLRLAFENYSGFTIFYLTKKVPSNGI